MNTNAKIYKFHANAIKFLSINASAYQVKQVTNEYVNYYGGTDNVKFVQFNVQLKDGNGSFLHAIVIVHEYHDEKGKPKIHTSFSEPPYYKEGGK
jgi:hypothetical protein